MLQFLLLFFVSFSVTASDLEQLAYSPKWQKLLHYRKTLFGNYQSEADGKEFFLHENGKYDPVAEIKKSVELFGSNPAPKTGDASCRFPARLKWLNKELGAPWKIDLSGCTTYIDFFSKVAARRASIIFSSYYLSNPNSAFGHTFLRLSRFDDKSETEMLDYGINYAVDARATNPLTYMVKGLFGGYPGRFAAVPYYYKVREYSDYEFRDVWSYELKLSMPQVLEMVDHVWELGHTYFDYFYFKENCSYHLLSVIDVVMPEKNLTENYDLFTIPADTIRLLRQEGLIDEGKRRESTYSRLMSLSKGLTAESLKVSKEITMGPEKTTSLLEGMNDQKAADILDVSIEAFDYYNVEKILTDDVKTKEIKSHILKSRAANPVITQFKPKDDMVWDSPAISHAPSRLSVSQGYEHNQGNETNLEWRFALHDLLDPQPGSIKEGQLEMFKVATSYKERDYRENDLIIENFSFFDLKNYPDQNFWASPLSWELDIGMRQIDIPGCFDCPASVVRGSVGNSLQIFNKRLLLALLINGEFNLHNYFTHGYRVALGPKIFTRFIFSEKWMMALSAYHQLNTYRFDEVMSDHDLKGDFELRYHLDTNFSLFIKLQAHERDIRWMGQGELGLRYFL